MSYYTLPRKQTINKICPTFNEECSQIISFSLLHYLNTAQEFVKEVCYNQQDNNSEILEHNIDFFYKIINPYEFIHNKAPGSKFAVSKIKSSSPTFYIFMEIAHIFKIFEPFNGRNIKSLHWGANNISTIECMNIFRENNNDINYENELDTDITSFKPIQGIEAMNIDFLYFEMNIFDTHKDTNLNKYVLKFITTICNILTYQNVNGTCIIKIDTLIHKPILDLVYILTGLYEKIYIIKPNTSNIFKTERFIICKNFISDYSKTLENNHLLKTLKIIIDESISNNKTISSLLKTNLPYYFLNKVEESNIIIGHLQLEQYDQLINLIKNKNRDDKIEILKKNNIQKCIQWCEKYKIPYNKFVDKFNIFLPIIAYNEQDLEQDLEQELNLEQELEQELDQELDQELYQDLNLEQENLEFN